ncbi:DUF1501 domain-containing protein [Tundrisphaera lichenicola]|uniref:DUF1501 domain-containing protein n=1 Tax=Tundrisphaera lichenicola TaxID=2029860 RepID=UPI003EC14D27
MSRDAERRPIQATRRDFLRDAVFGVHAIAAADLLLRDGQLRAAEVAGRSALHHAPRARQVIHIFLGGGLSQVDSFDYKPELEKSHGKGLPQGQGKLDVFNGKVGLLHKSHYEFKQRGQSGLWVSELFPEIAGVADELTVIRSMVAETANHIPGIFQANTGFRQMGFPSMGAWLSYGLGTENDSLPSFVVLPDARGIPNAAGGAFNWTSGFLPAQHQGVSFNTRGGAPILDLQPAGGAGPEVQHARLELLKELDAIHLEEESQTDPLIARIRSYELAARMQAAIPEATDFSNEPDHIKDLYGLDRENCRDTARNCLTARRLIERGVRMVQLWTGDGVSWDAHDDITGTGYKSHTGEALRVDRPIAGLIRDLKQRGLLESTVVMITTEFGRTPFAQADSGKINRGRDHHPQGFTNLLIGAGLKRGFAHGETDEIGYASVVDPVTTYDLHATVLHLLGIDHERLTFYHNGIQRRLTNVHGHVVENILA